MESRFEKPILKPANEYWEKRWNDGEPVESFEWFSPDMQYRIDYQVRVLEVGRCDIFHVETGRHIVRTYRDHYTPPVFCWLERKPGPILIWADTYLEGYQVINLETPSLDSVRESEEDFIWTDCALSPDQTMLAVGGCYWACPYEIRILNVNDNPLALPLRVITEFPLVNGKLVWTAPRVISIRDENSIVRSYRVESNPDDETGNRQ